MTGREPTYIFAGGGTGGHLAPAVAVAERLTEMDAQARVIFLCTERAIDKRFLAPLEYEIQTQPIRPLPGRNPLRWVDFLIRWRSSIRQSHKVLRELQPTAVLGLGGFAAGPMVKVAAGSVRTGLLNPDAVPGKANQYLAGRADAVFTQFAMSAGCFPERVRGKVRQIGCPVRRRMTAGERGASIAKLGLKGDRRTLAVMGGSLGAQSVNEAVLGLRAMLTDRADRWQVLHITGPGKSAAIEQAYAQAGVGCSVLDFTDDMGSVYAAADLMVARGGANTIAELTATGTPGVIMPYPYHADNHQAHNAADMVAAGAAVIVDDAVDADLNAERLGRAIMPLLDDESALARMAAASANLGRVDAAEAVAKWLIGTAAPR